MVANDEEEMDHASPSGGWKTTKSLVVTPLLAAGVLVVFGLAAEIAARSSWVRANALPPSVGSRYRLLDQHLAQLDRLAGSGVKFDCIVLGNSLPMAAIDPEALGMAFGERSGRVLECYTVGVPGMRAPGAAALARVMFEDYGVWLVIYGTSSRDFAIATAELGLAGLPWLRYRNGELSFEGWLVDHSYAYRYYLLFDSWRIPEQRRFVEYQFKTSPRGWIAMRRGGNPQNVDLNDVVPKMRDPVFKQLGRGPMPNQLERLGALARLNEPERQVLVVEMPSSPALSASLEDDVPTYRAIIQEMEKETVGNGVPFWRPPAAGVIPDEGWVDLWHMNSIGAEAYSRWLGRRLADAIAAGELRGPSS